MKIFKKIIQKITRGNSIYIDENKYLIKKYLPNNPIILEAGASDGRDTLQMASMWPKAKIHSFEPIPALFIKAKNKVSDKTNVTLYPYALSDKSGQIKINVSGGMSEGSSSILTPLKHLEIHPGVKFENKIEVTALTIDDWAKQTHIDKVDFMWLDLQGAEYKVLSAAPEILLTVKVLFTEVSLIETYKGVKVYPEYRRWLEKQGFRVVLEDLPYEDMGNVLFVRK